MVNTLGKLLRTVEELECKLAEPSSSLVNDIARLDGDILVLGVGGKMGPSLAKLAKNAIDQAGSGQKVIGAARFSSKGLVDELNSAGVQTIVADVTKEADLAALPDVKNVIFMVGLKFGTTGKEHLTWLMNSYIPGRVAERFRSSRIVVFSSGNVYPLTPVYGGGASEEQPTGPVGEYAQSVLGRERVFENFSHRYNIPMVLFRLMYAIDLRYGVLFEVANAVKEGRPIDLSMGNANVIWQGDANEQALRSLHVCDCPPRVLTITGPETISIRWLATRFGELLGVEPVFTGSEQPTALLGNASRSHQLFGYPRVTLREMIELTAEWVKISGPSLGKATHFQERQGKF